METNKIYHGNAKDILKTFPDHSIDIVMTSPPYWALRDYGVTGQLGLEPTFEEYISKLCDIFDEVKRVLKNEGTCWVNIGDTYANPGCGEQGATGGRDKSTLTTAMAPIGTTPTKRQKQTIPEKSLCMIPFRFSIEMVNRGWILRNTIIWYKPNCMPESVKDRFTTDFEYLFFFSKSQKYYFEQQHEPLADASIIRLAQDRAHQKGSSRANGGRKMNGAMKAVGGNGTGFQGHSGYFDKNGNLIGNGMRNKRCVWKIPPRPCKEAHFATYPPELCEIPIKAGCPLNGVVLDPFMGSGTTAVVAQKLGRQYVGIELNPAYIEIAEKRLLQKPLLVAA